jgi:hypothetical protein
MKIPVPKHFPIIIYRDSVSKPLNTKKWRNRFTLIVSSYIYSYTFTYIVQHNPQLLCQSLQNKNKTNN